MASPELSIIIPAYNEALRLPKTLQLVQHYLEGCSPFVEYEIIVVDDGSTDNTVKEAQEFIEKDALKRIRLIQNDRNRGKGYTVRHGFQEAKGKYILFSDADLSTPIEELAQMLPYLESHDIVIASRGLAESQIEIEQSFFRIIMGKVFGILMRTLLLPGIQDSQCGFKLFSSESVQWLLQQNLQVQGFAFDVEILYLARKHGFLIKEVPVHWFNAEGTKVNPILDPIRMFFHLFYVRLYHQKVPKKDKTN